MNKGVLYFIVGDKKNQYFDMAVRSVKSLKQYMPSLKCTLFTPNNLEERGLDQTVFDTVIQTDPPENVRHGLWRYKYDCFLASPYDVTLHLDADTFICDDFSEVFDMMGRFDFVSPISPHYALDEVVPGVPACFPEICGGFMLWRKNDVTEAFWHRLKECLLSSSRRRADEPAIRRVMFEMNELKFALIPWEYTCVYSVPGYLQYKVKIIHGKDKNLNETIEEAAALFNKEPITKRVYTGEQIFKLKKIRKKFMEVDEIIPYGHWKKQDSDEKEKRNHT